MMSSGDSRRTHRLAVLFLASLALSSCTGPVSSPAGEGPASGGSSSQAGSPASQSPTPSIAHDGSTVLPTSEVGCFRLSPELIQQVLGSAAAGLQPAESDGNVDPNGIRRESCIYPLDAERTTTHAVVLEVTTFPSAEGLRASAPFESLNAPVDVPGVEGTARFARNELNGSTEYVLVIADGTKLTRLIVSRPPTVSWSTEDALAALRRLAAPS